MIITGVVGNDAYAELARVQDELDALACERARLEDESPILAERLAVIARGCEAGAGNRT